MSPSDIMVMVDSVQNAFGKKYSDVQVKLIKGHLSGASVEDGTKLCTHFFNSFRSLPLPRDWADGLRGSNRYRTEVPVVQDQQCSRCVGSGHLWLYPTDSESPEDAIAVGCVCKPSQWGLPRVDEVDLTGFKVRAPGREWVPNRSDRQAGLMPTRLVEKYRIKMAQAREFWEMQR